MVMHDDAEHDTSAVPDDEAITHPDLSKVFEDDDSVDPLDPDAIPSDEELPPHEDDPHLDAHA
jgi:hypothetical protein